MKKLLLLFMLIPVVALAQAPPASVFSLHAGVNAVWFDQPGGSPSDFEAGLSGAASLSPHISLVGSTFYGFDNSYMRGSLGARLTATDVNNPNFSVGFGIQRQFSSEPALRPEEWTPDATVGWRPWPESKVILGAQGQYGLTSGQAAVLVAVRYRLVPAI